jgi:HD-GYP domain-containing protein (c-di-GMP phosphodiesterase class II)
MTRTPTTTRLRFADLLGGLSIVADMGFGLPPGQAMRSCLVATALARKLNLPESEVADTFYTALLMHVGCVSMSHETSVLFGNEHSLTRAVAMTDLGDPQDYVSTLIPEVSRGLAPAAREHLSTAIITEGQDFGRLYDTASGEVARSTAQQIGLPTTTQRALSETAESWRGDGSPRGLVGDDIALSARIVRAASDAAFFDDMGNAELAVNALKKRSGGTLDPAVVEAFIDDAPALLSEANSGDPRDRILEVEPAPFFEAEGEELVSFATAFADAGDLKSPFMQGHSRQVAEIAATAGEKARLNTSAVESLRVAGLLHDVGRVGVSNILWEKPGPLTTAEWELVRMHPYHSERILTISRTLEPIAQIAGMHHERLDGSGYYRGSKRVDIPMPARILAASDAFVAMTHDRPYRAAMEPQEAADELTAEARAGKLDPDAVAAVLHAAGQQRSGRGAKTRPAGLSEREVEVLRLVAQGCSNRDISERLSISSRTAEHHVQHIYTKIGLSTRPGAALFALQHELLS